MAEITVHGFWTSNNLKVRVALEHKGIDHEFREIDPADRDEVVRISGQHLTPVMVHGDRVLFDSAAILRYLDANFPDTPKLFPGPLTRQWEVEEWESFGRGALAAPMTHIVHTRVSGGEVDEATLDRCRRDLAAALGRLEERLAGRDWLVGDTLTAADITCAAVVHRIRASGILPLPEDLAHVDPWVARVMAPVADPT